MAGPLTAGKKQEGQKARTGALLREGKGDRMHKHGGDVYRQRYRMDYSVNINPLGTPEPVMAAACEGIRHSAQYPDVDCEALREKLAKAEGVKEEQLIFGNGAADLIFSLALAVKPKETLVPAPTFVEYEQAVRTVDSQVVYHKLRKENGFVLGREILEEITPRTDMVFLCNPNNPTGLLAEKELLLEILEKCAACKALLVIDECFNAFLDRPEDYSMKEYMDSYPNLFILKAFTKIYAMPGLRLGYGLCADPALLSRMREANQPWNVSIPAQYAGTAALDETAYVKRCRDMLSGERDYLKKHLKELGFQALDSQANYIFFHAFPELGRELADRGILIRDCSNFVGLEEGYFRIAVKTHEENKELINTMKEVMKWQRQL